jgi:YesN/AraC family two-component response regulator
MEVIAMAKTVITGFDGNYGKLIAQSIQSKMSYFSHDFQKLTGIYPQTVRQISKT